MERLASTLFEDISVFMRGSRTLTQLP